MLQVNGCLQHNPDIMSVIYCRFAQVGAEEGLRSVRPEVRGATETGFERVQQALAR